MRNKTHLIFDMDGTLIDSSELLANTINYVRKAIGLTAMDETTIIQALNDTSINPAEFYYEAERFEPIHEEHFQRYYLQNHHKESRLYDGVADLLAAVDKRCALSIATNAYEVSARPLLERFGIADYFDLVLCADQVPKPKPHPIMIETIIGHYGAPKNDFLMIGDGRRDIEAAKRAGIEGLLVGWGFSSHDDAVDSIEALAQSLGV
jgi:phosphoglycolate phosphatase